MDKVCTMSVEDRLRFIAYELKDIYGGRMKLHSILNMLIRPLGLSSWNRRKETEDEKIIVLIRRNG